MAKGGDYGIEFLNVELKFAVELVAEDGELLTDEDLVLWMAEATRNMFKFGFGYNSKSRSFTVSVTDRGSVVGDAKPMCLTQHGKNHFAALQKCHFIIEVCGRGEMREEIIAPNLERREEVLQEQIAGLLKKKP